MSPKCVLLFSGKRKSGKDFLTDLLLQRIGSKDCAILKLSGPIKKHWALANNLDFDKLLDASEYKEHHRLEMIKFGEDMRKQDYGYFCKAAIELYEGNKKSVWIVSDARRRSDLKWFSEQYGEAVKTVRVQADDEVRKKRGWIYTKGVDDAESECDLDAVTSWDWVITNNDSGPAVEEKLQEIFTWVQKTI